MTRNTLKPTDATGTRLTGPLSFEIRNGQIAQPNTDWVYVWKELSSEGKIVRVGATWLHPAARAEKHVRERDPGAVDVVAFRVPAGIDRGRARNLVAQALGARGLLSPSASIGARGSLQTIESENLVTEGERAFAEFVLEHFATSEGRHHG